jgi:protein CpxP
MNRTFHRHLVTCALLVGMGVVTAQAQPAAPAGGPAPQARHFDPAKMAERVNRHLAALKQKLQVSASQENAWNSFASAMQPPTNMQRPDRQAMASMTTPERIDQMRAMRDRRNAEMDRRAEATKTFYAQLTPEQKKTFDTETARMGHGHKHGPRGQRPQGAPAR